MGFRDGAWMSVFEVIPKTENITTIRGTISQRDKNTGEYVQDFSRFCSCLGAEVAKKAAGISPAPTPNHPARIRLKRVEVKTPDVKQPDGSWKSYDNYIIWDFDFGEDLPVNAAPQQKQSMETYGMEVAYEGVSDDPDSEGLPF